MTSHIKMAASEGAHVANMESIGENTRIDEDFLYDSDESSDDSVKDKDFLHSDSGGSSETTEVGLLFRFL